MRFVAAATLLTAGLLFAPAVSTAQSLAEIAAREREKKKKPVKVITEEELRQAGRSGTPANVGERAPAALASPAAPDASASPAAQAATAAATPKEKTEDELRAEQEKVWRERLKKAQADVARLTAEIDRLQTAVNDMGLIYGSARTNNLNKLEEFKKQLASAQQSVADLQEEGRRARFTP